MHQLKALKKAFDWQTYIETTYENYRVARSRNGTEYRVNCPNCGDSKQKLYVNVDKGLFNCFKCSFGSKDNDIFDFVAISEGIPRGQAIKSVLLNAKSLAPTMDELIEAYGNEHEPSVQTPQVKSIRLPKEAVKITPDHPAWTYLSGRGFTGYDLQVTNAHYCETGIFRGRVLFPVYLNGALVAYQGRSIRGDTPKYLSSPGAPLGASLWPCVPPKDGVAVLVEGVIDAISIRRAGFNAYATFGKKLTEEQKALLLSWDTKELIVWWDIRDAKPNMMELAEKAKLNFDKIYIPNLYAWPKEQDAGDLLRDPQGPARIKETLSTLIDTDDTLEYLRWKMSP